MSPETCCSRCENLAVQAGLQSAFSRSFIVCGNCGNKRCPKATDHRLAPPSGDR